MILQVDIVGFAAATASLAAVASTRIVSIRIAMIVSNVLFILWGALGMLLPPLVLHSILLPVNVLRLWQITRKGRAERTTDARTSVDQLAWARDPLSHPDLQKMSEVEKADLQFQPKKVLSE